MRRLYVVLLHKQKPQARETRAKSGRDQHGRGTNRCCGYVQRVSSRHASQSALAECGFDTIRLGRLQGEVS